MKMTSNVKTNEDELKNDDVLKNCPPTAQQFCPPSYYDITWIFLTTSHLDSHTKNDVKPEMLSGVQTGNRIPHDRYDVRGIAHARSYIKDDIFMQRRLGQIFTYILKWGQMTCKKSRPYLARAYTTLVVLVRIASLKRLAIFRNLISNWIVVFHIQSF